MAAKKCLFVLLFILLFISSAFAQYETETEPTAENAPRGFWFDAGADTALYSYSDSAAFGGGLSIGYGRRTAIGLKAAYYYDPYGVSTIELNFLLRLYLLKKMPDYGPFFQFAGGPALFLPKNRDFSVPSEAGMICAGLGLGWRFRLGKILYIEPAVRGGYPYIFGGGIAFGVRR